MNDWCPMSYVVVETPDGRTYEQPFNDIHDLDELLKNLGDGYKLVSIY